MLRFRRHVRSGRAVPGSTWRAHRPTRHLWPGKQLHHLAAGEDEPGRARHGGIAWNNEGSFHKDEWRDKRFDFILANPPFNVSDWGGERLREDVRWKFGVPPVTNANYAWLQHIIHHLAPNGTAGVVLANGSMSSTQNGEDEIRRAMIEADIVDCMIALPGQLFYSTQIPACLWFLSRNKQNGRFRNRRSHVLFIDTRKLGTLVDRTRKEFSDNDIAKITRAMRETG
jgi:type I restriction enzyme M protein